jgi:hypothetical protein
LEFPCLDSAKAYWLERPFQEEEVHQALLSMDGNKVSALDDFTIGFFFWVWSCWTTMKDDLMGAFHNAHEHEVFEKSLNATFIALIPKNIGQLEENDFRPNNLTSSVNKILA